MIEFMENCSFHKKKKKILKFTNFSSFDSKLLLQLTHVTGNLLLSHFDVFCAQNKCKSMEVPVFHYHWQWFPSYEIRTIIQVHSLFHCVINKCDVSHIKWNIIWDNLCRKFVKSIYSMIYRWDNCFHEIFAT